MPCHTPAPLAQTVTSTDAPVAVASEARGAGSVRQDAAVPFDDALGGGSVGGHRGSGSGPVAVTRRCGTQSSTWTKPSNVAPSRTQES